MDVDVPRLVHEHNPAVEGRSSQRPDARILRSFLVSRPIRPRDLADRLGSGLGSTPLGGSARTSRRACAPGDPLNGQASGIGRETPATTGRLVPQCSHGRHTLVMGQQGRLVIPAEVRAALGLVPGDRLHLHLAGPRLVLERQQDAVAELRGLASDVPKSRSFVDELLAERRLAAATE